MSSSAATVSTISNGEADSDLLIGGSTVFDDDLHHIEHLAEVWGSDARTTRNWQKFKATRSMPSSNPTPRCSTISWPTFFSAERSRIGSSKLASSRFTPRSRTNTKNRRTKVKTTRHGHHHPLPTIVHELPPLEGFEFMDSLDKLSDITNGRTNSLEAAAPREHDAPERAPLDVRIGALRPGYSYRDRQRKLVRSEHLAEWCRAQPWRSRPHSRRRRGHGRSHNCGSESTRFAWTANSRSQRRRTLSCKSTRSWSPRRARSKWERPSGRFRAESRRGCCSPTMAPSIATYDPFGISRGFISHGAVSIHGATVTSQAAVVGSAPSRLRDHKTDRRFPPVGKSATRL